MPTVYVETTIPSYYFETRRSTQSRAWREATRTWWDAYRTEYELVTSDAVLAELRLGPAAKSDAALRLLQDVPLLEELPGTRDVATYYIEHKLMPADALGDAAHVAIASMHRIDFLLTWNCRHLANANKAPHLRILNGRLGLPVPTLTTPLNLVPEPPR